MRRVVSLPLLLLMAQAIVVPTLVARADGAPQAPNAAASKAAAPAPHGHEGHVHEEGEPGHAHEHDESQEAFDEASKPFGGSASNGEYLWRQSDRAFHDGEYDRAIGLHRAIVALDPTDVESYGVAAWLLWSSDKKDEAIAHIKRGIAANPTDSEMWAEAGQHYNVQKHYAEARDAYAKAVEYAPAGSDTVLLRRFLGHAAEKSGDIKLSLDTWRGLVRDYPNDAVNKNNLARVEKLENPGVAS
jgi:tetratricopeptide (TPR) repeat protein